MPIVGAIFGGLDLANYFTVLGPIPEGFTGNPESYAELKAAGVAVLGWLPFFAPDGENLAFFASGQIKVAPVAGGPARTIGTAPGGFFGGVWTSGNVIVFSGPSNPPSRKVKVVAIFPSTGFA